jgi:glycosyltransferase involved in cell wall biosynthesis
MITQSPYPQDSRPRKQAELLAAKGFQVDIICRAKNQPKFEKFGNVTVYRVMKYGGSEKMHNYIIESSLFFMLAFLKLQSLYVKRKYNLIQIHNMPNYHIFTALLQKILKVPLILDLHDLTVELFEIKWPGKKHVFLKTVDKLIERISCRFANALITVTEGCKERLVERGNPPEKITIIYNSANQNIFRFDYERKFSRINEGAKLLYHGTVAKRFGIHIAIDAMAKLINYIPGSKLFIYGRYFQSYKDELESQIKMLKLSDVVFLYERISLEECFIQIKEADIGIVPYVNSDYGKIGLSNKTFEYAASGLPVIASRLPSFKSIFGENCIEYAEPENPSDFADKIIKLCKNPERRKEQTFNAYQAVSGISGEVMDNRYFNLISKLIDRTNHH